MGSPSPASAPSLAFTRPSRSGGRTHLVTCDPQTLRPLSCTCLAGLHGRLCWAVINIAAEDLEPIADQRWRQACGEVDIRRAAAVLTQVRKWARAARELESLRSCGYYPTRALAEASA